MHPEQKTKIHYGRVSVIYLDHFKLDNWIAMRTRIPKNLGSGSLKIPEGGSSLMSLSHIPARDKMDPENPMNPSNPINIFGAGPPSYLIPHSAASMIAAPPGEFDFNYYWSFPPGQIPLKVG